MGTITITGGTIEATTTDSAGNAVQSKGELTIGNKDDNRIASNESPVLIGSNRGIVKTNGTDFNFYDGIVKAPEGKTITGTITDTPEGYRIINGTEETLETAYLDNYYTVTFDGNGATPSKANMTVEYGIAYGELATVSRTGYTFDGWKLNETTITATTNVSTASDHTLIAQWTPKTYNLMKVSDTNNIIDNGTFEDYSIVDAPGYAVSNGSLHTWDKALNGIPGDTEHAYKATKWGAKVTGWNSGVPVPEIGYHAHMRVIDGNAVARFKTNEDYAGKTQADLNDGVSLKEGEVTTNRWLGISQSIEGNKIIAGKTYMLTVDVYRISGSTICTGGLYYATTESGTTKSFGSGYLTFRPTQSGQWETIRRVFTVKDNYSYEKVNPSIYIYGYEGTGAGELLVDNIRLQEITPIQKSYDSAYTSAELAQPTREGYTFQGWYKESEYTTPISTLNSFNTLTASFVDVNTAGTNAYIYAKWQANNYTVTFNPNGGTVDPTTKSVTFDKTYGTLPTPEKAGYTFNGWKLNGSSVTETTAVSTASAHTLVADWTPTPYTITYDYNGGSLAQGSTETTTYTIEDTVTLPTATKTGYNFVGWKEQGADDSTAVTQISATTGNKNLVAVYTNGAVSYKIHHFVENANDNNYTEEPVEIVTTLKGVTPETPVTTGDVITLNNTQAKTIANTTVEKVTSTPNGENGGTVTVAADSSTEIYVYYKRDKFDLTVTAGTNTTNATGTGNYKWGQTVAISAETTDTIGYTYSNFTWTATPNTAEIASASSKTTTITMPAANTTVTATSDKTADTYTISYSLDGGATSTANPETYNVESAAITLNNPTKTGYTFAGWTGTDLSEATTTVTIPQGSTGNRSYTATWTATNYTITYDLDGGSVTGTNPTAYTIESNNITLINPTKEGYTFAGWTGTDLSEATSAVTIAQGSTGNRSYTATWTANTYTVTLDANEGAVNPDEITVTYGGAYGTIPTPTRTGYTFDGWFINETEIEETTTVSTASDHTLTAHWTVNTHTLTYDYGTNGGQISSSDNATSTTEEKDYGTNMDLTKSAYKANNAFLGWAETAEATTALATSATLTMPDANKTMYAIYANMNVSENIAEIDLSDAENPTHAKSITVSGSNYGTASVTSSDSTTATASIDGNTITITAVKTGTATITVTSSQKDINGDPITKTITVNVIKTPTAISVTPETTVLGVSQNNVATLSATITPTGTTNHNTITWTSSNPAVATVDQSGNVTAVAEGTTTITVATGKNNAVTATATIIVDNTAPTVTITRQDYNTFTWTATDTNNVVGYVISTTNTTPTSWVTSGITNGTASGSRDISSAGTYYVWAKDVAGNIGVATIDVFTVTRSQGNRTTLTTIADGTTTENGNNITSTTTQVLSGTPLYVAVTPNTGYLATLKQDDTEITSGNVIEVSANTTFSSTATEITYNIEYSLDGGTAGANAPTTATFNQDITVPAPTKAGYTFTGWTATGLGNEAMYYYDSWTGETQTGTGNNRFYRLTSENNGTVTLIAHWTPNTYTISYTLDGGTAGTKAPTSATYDANVQIDNPTKVGYQFAGWTSLESNTTYALGSNAQTGATENDLAAWDGTATSNTYFKNLKENGTVRLTATWTMNTYNIEYSLDGGTLGANSPTTATFNQDITVPAPTKAGYTFTGWTATGLGNEAMYYYDSWTGETQTGTGNNRFYRLTSENNGTVTLIAHWTPNTYTISYTLGGGTAGTNAPTSATYDTNVQIDNPTRTGYQFAGWTSLESNNYVLGSNAQTGTTENNLVAWDGTATTNTYFKNLKESGTVRLTATWTENTYNITYDYEGGTAGARKPSSSTYTGEVRISSPTKEGYTFAGWTSSAEDGLGANAITGSSTAWNGSAVSNGSNDTYFKKLSDVNGGTVKLTATWTPITYRISYTLNGGTAGANAPTTATYGSDVQIDNPTKTGYTFAGWTSTTMSNTALTGTSANPSTSWDGTATTNTYFKNLTPVSNRTVLLVATWREEGYNITYDYDGGTPGTNNPTNATYTGSFGVSIPTKEGYTFAGWTSSAEDGLGANAITGSSTPWNGSAVSNGSNDTYFKQLTNVNGGTVKLTATWTPISYRIAYNYDGGTAGTNAPTIATYDSDVQIDNPTKAGYQFAGWTSTTMSNTALTGTSANPSTSWNGTATTNTYFKNLTPVSNRTVLLVATWTENNYNVTYDYDGGTPGTSNSPSATYTGYVIVSRPTKEGYTFAGWTSSAEDGLGANAITGSSTAWDGSAVSNGGNDTYFKKLTDVNGGTVKLTATWTPNTYTIAYNLNGGTAGANAPTSATYGLDVEIDNPTKDGYGFTGWTATGVGTNAKTGTTANPTTAWDGSRTVNTFFKNLVPSGSITLVANWVQYNYLELSPAGMPVSGYQTLSEAFTNAQDGYTIKALQNVEDASSAEIITVDNKSIKFDLNGKKITLNKMIGVGHEIDVSDTESINNAGLDIYSSVDGGEIESSVERAVIDNYKGGQLTLNGTSEAHTMKITGTNTSTNARIIINDRSSRTTLNDNVTLTFANQAATTGNRYVIISEGLVEVDGATLRDTAGNKTGNIGIGIASSAPETASVVVKSGTIETSGSAIVNRASTSSEAIKISGDTTLIKSTHEIAISNRKAGTVKVLGGKIEGTSGIVNDVSSGVGTIEISGGEITATSATAVAAKTGNATISGANTKITGVTYGVTVTTGNLTILEGTIEATQVGVNCNTSLQTKGTLTLGNNQTPVSIQTPSITGGTQGVYVVGTFNYYDGIIEAPTGKTMNVSPTDTPDGYIVQTTVDNGVETATLATTAANYAEYATSTSKTVIATYTTLEDAFTSASSGNVIKPLRSATDASVGNPTVGAAGSPKTITLDLGAKTVTMAKSIENNGTLTIQGTRQSTGVIGTLQSDETNAILNNAGGTLNLNGGKVAQEGNLDLEDWQDKYGVAIVNKSSGTINVDGAEVVSGGTIGDTINNTAGGTVNVRSGKVLNTVDYDSDTGDAISNVNGGEVVVSGGTINATGFAISNGNGQVEITAGTIEGEAGIGSTDGSVEISGTANIIGNGLYAIFMMGTAPTLTMSGGSVYGNTGIVANAGTVTITRGTVEAEVCGIQFRAGTTVTLGTEDSNTPNENQPTITANTQSTTYAIKKVAVGGEYGTFNFYDGKIVAPTGKTINGSVDDTPDGYEVATTVVDGVETAKLVQSAQQQNNTSPSSTQSPNFLRRMSTKAFNIVTSNSDGDEGVEKGEEHENTEENANVGETSDKLDEESERQIAQVNETTYTDINEAIAAVNSGNEINILEDLSLTEEVIIESDKNIIINLNGKTITSTSSNTINNKGTLTITGTGIIKNEVENGVVIYNTGVLNIENGVITTSANGGKAIFNNGDNSNSENGTINIKGGKIVTEGIGAIGIYNVNKSKAIITGGIFETRGYGSKTVYNESDIEVEKAKIIVAEDDSIGIYNAKEAKSCLIKETEITIEAEEIANYELIKNTDQFKEELEKMKPSYGIYNDSKVEVVLESGTIKVERLKGVGIINNFEGSITMGKEDDEVNTSTPIIYAISDNTTAIINSDSEKGEINFYDGKTITIQSIKNIFTGILKEHYVFEEIGANNVVSYLKKIEEVLEKTTENSSKEDTSNLKDDSNYTIDNQETVEKDEVKPNSAENESTSKEDVDYEEKDKTEVVEEDLKEENSL